MGSEYFQEYGHCCYSLRKNPKKTYRVTVSDQETCNYDIETRILTRCQFKRQRDECTSHDFEKVKLGFDPFCPVRKKRSKLEHKVSRFKNVSGFFSEGSKFSEFNEEEEVALSMLMFSSDFTNYNEFVSDFESSGKDVLLSKAKFLHGIEKEFKVESDEAGYEKECVEATLGDHNTVSGLRLNSCYSNSVDFVRGNALEKPVMGDNLDINFSDSGIEKGNKVLKSQETGFNDTESGGFVRIDGCVGMGIDGFVGKEIDGCAGLEIEGSFGTKPDGSVNMKIDNLVDSKIDVSAGAEIVGDFGSEIGGSVSEISKNCDKKLEFECNAYQRRIPSFQALEDDRTKNCDRKAYVTGNSYKQKKNKYIHECSVCFKVFPTGQALGGHKRAHYKGFPENKNKERALMCQESVMSIAGFSFGEQFGPSLGLSL